ncbi:MAG: methylated-DNA--[protein]-cysteine S-methyltransferase [Clostridiales bacterium]|nr:methylated-DNA--[protein]-cysteine S-methyltransferase [Clostridiales bacterium]
MKKCIETPVGFLSIIGDRDFVTGIEFEFSKDCGKSEVLDRAAVQLMEYFEGRRRAFNLPVLPEGTEFCRHAWRALMEIPYGETVSYSELARRMGNTNACRAVGGAMNKNPLPIIIPCHRVVGKNGVLTGYSAGIEIKRRLLLLENPNLKI